MLKLKFKICLINASNFDREYVSHKSIQQDVHNLYLFYFSSRTRSQNASTLDRHGATMWRTELTFEIPENPLLTRIKICIFYLSLSNWHCLRCSARYDLMTLKKKPVFVRH